MQVELTGEEATLLREVLEHTFADLREEMHKTEALEWKRALKAREQVLDGVLAKRIGPLSEDAIGYTLQRQDPAGIFARGCDLARDLKRNGVIHSTWARGPDRGRGRWH